MMLCMRLSTLRCRRMGPYTCARPLRCGGRAPPRPSPKAECRSSEARSSTGAQMRSPVSCRSRKNITAGALAPLARRQPKAMSPIRTVATRWLLPRASTAPSDPPRLDLSLPPSHRCLPPTFPLRTSPAGPELHTITPGSLREMPRSPLHGGNGRATWHYLRTGPVVRHTSVTARRLVEENHQWSTPHHVGCGSPALRKRATATWASGAGTNRFKETEQRGGSEEP